MINTIYYVCGCFACMDIYAQYMCLLPAEARRGCPIPWSWSYRLFGAAKWVLRTEARSSGRATSVPNC